MISEIEAAAVDRIKTKLATAAGTVDVQRGVEGIPQPAVYVSVEAGKFAKVAQRKWKQTVTVYVDVVFSYLGSDGERRKGVNLILQGIIQTLLEQKLGLAIDPLVPGDWSNTTTEELRKGGLIAFSLRMQTAFVMKQLDEEEAVDLLRVGLNYFLQDPADDDVADAADVVELDQT